MQRLVAELGHRQEVGEDLGRVELIGQAVPDRDAGELRQLLDDLLAEAAVLDPVVDAPEHARGVLHRLLVADLRAARAEVGDVSALVVRGDLEGHARARRGLLEDHRDVLAAHSRLLVAAVLGALQVTRQVEEVANLPGAEVEELGEVPIPQVVAHGRPPPRQSRGARSTVSPPAASAHRPVWMKRHRSETRRMPARPSASIRRVAKSRGGEESDHDPAFRDLPPNRTRHARRSAAAVQAGLDRRVGVDLAARSRRARRPSPGSPPPGSRHAGRTARTLHAIVAYSRSGTSTVRIPSSPSSSHSPAGSSGG